MTESLPIKSQTVALRPIPAILNENAERVVDVVESKVDVIGKFKEAQFVNANCGWAGTSKTLYKTTNGGKSWEHIALNLALDSTVASFYFIDDASGWVAVVSQFVTERFGYGNSSHILVTRDAGKSWAKQADFPDEVRISYIKFLNANEGLAIGAKVVGEKPPYSEIFGVSTKDGGKTWNRISESIKSAIENEYGIANDNGLYITWSSTSQIFILTTFGRIITSIDDAETWNTIVQFKDVRPNNSESSTGYYKLILDPRGRIRIIAGASGEEGIWGDLIVHDDRNSWVSYELKRIVIRDAVFLSDTKLVACGWDSKNQQTGTSILPGASGVILHSIDTGKSWSAIYRSKSNETVVSLLKVSDNQFYSLSDSGTFMRFTLSN